MMENENKELVKQQKKERKKLKRKQQREREIRAFCKCHEGIEMFYRFMKKYCMNQQQAITMLQMYDISVSKEQKRYATEKFRKIKQNKKQRRSKKKRAQQQAKYEEYVDQVIERFTSDKEILSIDDYLIIREEFFGE